MISPQEVATGPDGIHYGTYIIQTLVSLVGTVAGIKVAINGMTKTLDKVEAKLDALVAVDSDHASKIAVLEDWRRSVDKDAA